MRARGLEIVLEACHHRARRPATTTNDYRSQRNIQVQHQQHYERRVQQWIEERVQSIKLDDQYRKQVNAIQILTSSSSSSVSGVGNTSSTLEQATFTACLVRRIIESL